MSHAQQAPDLITGQGEPTRWGWKEAAAAGLGSIAGPLVIYALAILLRSVVSPEDRGGATLIAYGLPLLGAAAFFHWYARRNHRELRAKVARSVVVPGEVTAVEVSGIPGDAGYREMPTLRFSPGKTAEPREVVAATSHEKLTVGESVQVRFDPQDDAWAIVDGPDPDHSRAVLRTTVALAAFGLAPIVWGVAKIVAS